MNAERIKEIQGKTAYPDSVSVQQALLQVLNECQQDFKKTLAELERVKTTRDQYFKAAIHAQDKLTQAEKELEELKKGQGKQLFCDECKSENIRDTDYGKQCSECFKYI